MSCCRDLAPFAGSVEVVLWAQVVRAVMMSFQVRTREGEAFLLEAFLFLQSLRVSGLVKVRGSLGVIPIKVSKSLFLLFC